MKNYKGYYIEKRKDLGGWISWQHGNPVDERSIYSTLEDAKNEIDEIYFWQHLDCENGQLIIKGE